MSNFKTGPTAALSARLGKASEILQAIQEATKDAMPRGNPIRNDARFFDQRCAQVRRRWCEGHKFAAPHTNTAQQERRDLLDDLESLAHGYDDLIRHGDPKSQHEIPENINLNSLRQACVEVAHLLRDLPEEFEDLARQQYLLDEMIAARQPLAPRGNRPWDLPRVRTSF